MDRVIEVVRAIRNVRADVNVTPSAQVPLVVFAEDAWSGAFRAHEALLAKLAGVGSIDYRRDGERPKGAAVAAVEGAELAIPLAGLVDPVAERARIGKQLDKLAKEVEGIARKLGNAQFVEKAPPEVVEEQRARSAELAERRSVLERTLERLAAL